MQMRRLEERIGKPIFARDGRASKLTEDGERLLSYARRMVRLSDETIAAFDETELSGSVNLGTPDDYADRFLPEILARFARSNPRVEVSVTCEQSTNLLELARTGDIDLAIVTNCGEGPVEVIRQEPLLWVASSHHGVARGGGAAARPLEGAVHVAHRRVRRAVERRTEISRALYQRQFDRDLGRRARRPRGHRRRRIGASPGHARPQRSRRLPAAADLRDRHRPLLAPAELGGRRQARRAHRVVARQSVVSAVAA